RSPPPQRLDVLPHRDRFQAPEEACRRQEQALSSGSAADGHDCLREWLQALERLRLSGDSYGRSAEWHSSSRRRTGRASPTPSKDSNSGRSSTAKTARTAQPRAAKAGLLKDE